MICMNVQNVNVLRMCVRYVCIVRDVCDVMYAYVSCVYVFSVCVCYVCMLCMCVCYVLRYVMYLLCLRINVLECVHVSVHVCFV